MHISAHFSLSVYLCIPLSFFHISIHSIIHSFSLPPPNSPDLSFLSIFPLFFLFLPLFLAFSFYPLTRYHLLSFISFLSSFFVLPVFHSIYFSGYSSSSSFSISSALFFVFFSLLFFFISFPVLISSFALFHSFISFHRLFS